MAEPPAEKLPPSPLEHHPNDRILYFIGPIRSDFRADAFPGSKRYKLHLGHPQNCQITELLSAIPKSAGLEAMNTTTTAADFHAIARAHCDDDPRSGPPRITIMERLHRCTPTRYILPLAETATDPPPPPRSPTSEVIRSHADRTQRAGQDGALPSSSTPSTIPSTSGGRARGCRPTCVVSCRQTGAQVSAVEAPLGTSGELGYLRSSVRYFSNALGWPSSCATA